MLIHDKVVNHGTVFGTVKFEKQYIHTFKKNNIGVNAYHSEFNDSLENYHFIYVIASLSLFLVQTITGRSSVNIQCIYLTTVVFNL